MLAVYWFTDKETESMLNYVTKTESMLSVIAGAVTITWLLVCPWMPSDSEVIA